MCAGRLASTRHRLWHTRSTGGWWRRQASIRAASDDAREEGWQAAEQARRSFRRLHRHEDAAPAARDQRAHVGDGHRPFPRVLIRHVAGHPFRIELVLVVAQTLEVVPLLSTLEE